MLSGYLAIICASGVAAVWISGYIKKFPVPLVVAEIVIGMIIGKTGFALLPPPNPAAATTLAQLSDLGFLFLMFLVGTHLPLRDPGLRSALGKGSTATALAFVLAALAGFFILSNPHVTSVNQPLIFMLLLANSSAAVIEPLVEGKQLFGKIVLQTRTWSAIADTITIVALPLALAPSRLENAIAGTGAVIVIAALSLYGLKWFRSSKWGDEIRQKSKKSGFAIDFKMSLTILFALSFIAHDIFGVSNLIAGFAGGAVASLIGQPRRFAKQTVGLSEGLFVPIFFVLLGAQLSFSDLLHSAADIKLALFVALGTTIVHVLVAWAVRLPPLASGLTATAQLGLPAAVASLGLQQGTLTSGQAAAFITGSLLSIGICTLGTWLLEKYSEPPTETEAKQQAERHAQGQEVGHDG